MRGEEEDGKEGRECGQYSDGTESRRAPPPIGDGVGACDSNPGFVGGEEKAMGVAKMFTAGWVSERRPRTGRRARAWALSAAGLLAASDRGGHPRLGGGCFLLRWRGPAAVCAVVSLSIMTQGHVDKGWHDNSVIVVACRQQQGLQGRDVRQHQEEEGAAGEVVVADRGVLPPPVGVVGGDRGHVRRGGGEHERQSRGGD